MSSTYTDSLRITKQGDGDNSETWGQIDNTNYELFEDGIAGFTSISLTGSGDYTLTTNNGSSDQARNMILRLGGTPSAARNVLIPAISKVYFVECTVSASVTITLKASGGTGVDFLTGQTHIVYCDGLNTYKVGTNVSLGTLGITASAGEINILDGATVTVGELNILDGATVTVAELNVLDGITATVAELNVLDGITATVAELNVLDGITATVAELNVLDGITATVAELNILDGVTVSAGNLNALRGITSITNSFIGGSAKWDNGTAVVRGNIASLGSIGSSEFRIAFTSAYTSANAYSIVITPQDTPTFDNNLRMYVGITSAGTARATFRAVYTDTGGGPNTFARLHVILTPGA